jgi:hypothetical protein
MNELNRMKKIVYNKYTPYILYGLCLMYIIYFTIIWSLVFFELLQDRIKAVSSGYQFIDTSGGELTIKNLSIYLTIKLIMVISALLLLIKRNTFSIFFFIVMFLPVTIEFVLFIFNDLGAYVRLEGLGGAFGILYKEIIYNVLIILIFIISITFNIISQGRLKVNKKMFLILVISLALSIYFYYTYRLRF